MLTERQLHLFTDILEHYVRNSEPIGSKLLASSKNWDVSSATLRNEMSILEREGLIMQPYTSAGRIPTEKGYRLYRDLYLHPVDPVETIENVFTENDDISEESFKNFAKELSHLTELVVLVGRGNNDMYYTGTRYLLHQPEFRSQTEITEILSILEEREEEIANFFEALTGDTTVLIGSENPVVSSCSVVAVPVLHNDQIHYIGVLGPMRMHYRKVVGILNYYAQLLNH